MDGELEDHLAAGPSAARLHEAEMALGDLGVQCEVELAQAAALAPVAQQLAHGRVQPHAVAHRPQRRALGLGHAVEHLDLVTAFGKAQKLRGGHGMGQTADVVAAERGPQNSLILQ